MWRRLRAYCLFQSLIHLPFEDPATATYSWLQAKNHLPFPFLVMEQRIIWYDDDCMQQRQKKSSSGHICLKAKFIWRPPAVLLPSIYTLSFSRAHGQSLVYVWLLSTAISDPASCLLYSAFQLLNWGMWLNYYSIPSIAWDRAIYLLWAS